MVSLETAPDFKGGMSSGTFAADLPPLSCYPWASYQTHAGERKASASASEGVADWLEELHTGVRLMSQRFITSQSTPTRQRVTALAPGPASVPGAGTLWRPRAATYAVYSLTRLSIPDGHRPLPLGRGPQPMCDAATCWQTMERQYARWA